ncbi:NUDIX hydrolase, core domain protein [Candidatus Omnitrophus magneticus]|uniref:NUDIX hydrolase, core domain protein n=1 Tax=Candidatus Omnitrophus magneticus TaxID=1609969 RepID=A0A0F0CVE4_9BACT|nr:NUDIX hydrolase, core domain protein [Candidatus Omnitrophus magneticus]
MTEQISAGGVIIKKTLTGNLEILLIKDKYGHWTWPKGHIEKGETLEETALREIEEETGVKNLLLISKLAVQKYIFTFNKKKIFKKVHLFLFHLLTDVKITPQASEIDDAKWFPAPDAINIIEYKGAKEILEKAVKKFLTLKNCNH